MVGVSETGGVRCVASHLWQPPLVGQLPERACDLAMQLHLAARRDLVVAGVAEQCVHERVAARPAGLSGHETGQLGPLEGVDHRR